MTFAEFSDGVREVDEEELRLEKNEEVDFLPDPVGWRMLVEPIKIEEVTQGGIILAEESRQYAVMACAVGKVLKMGAACYRDSAFNNTSWCAVGDYVLYDRHAGQQIDIRSGNETRRYLIINDKDIRAKTAHPERIKQYV